MAKLVLANGVFDIFHYGHLRHLEAAYDMGGALIVAITSDKSVKKGPGRPIYPARQRAMLVGAIWCVERVIVVDSSIEALRAIEPDIFVKGSDYRRKMRPEDWAYCKRHGIKIRFTDEPRMSSSAIYDRLRQG